MLYILQWITKEKQQRVKTKGELRDKLSGNISSKIQTEYIKDQIIKSYLAPK